MCEYCELIKIGKGEFENKKSYEPIASIENGSHSIQISMDRYISEADGTNRSQLGIEFNVTCLDGNYTINETQIAIKYCPFCGEKF